MWHGAQRPRRTSSRGATQPGHKRLRAAWLALALIGFGLRLGWAIAITPRQGSDARWYWEAALGIAAGEGYRENGLPTAFHPVGYPAALAGIVWLFGDDQLAARVANALFGTLTLIASIGVTRALTRSNATALAAGLLFCCYPADIGFSATLLSEPLFNALLLAASWVFLVARPRQYGRFASAGVLFALATLTRPQGVLVPALMVAGRALVQPVRHWLPSASALALAFACTLAPWAIRNAYAFDAFVPISNNGGVNLYIGNNFYARGCYKFTARVTAPLAAAIPAPWKGGPNELALDRFAARLAWQFMRAQPKTALALWPLKLDCLFGHDLSFRSFSRKLPTDSQEVALDWLKLRATTYYRVLGWLSGLGLLLVTLESCSSVARRSWMWLPAAVVIGFVCVHLLSFGDARFHHPMMPWLIVYAAHALAAPWRYRRRASHRGR